MIRIVTDTGSDITYSEAEASKIEIVALGVKFDEFEYDYHNDLDFSVFYQNLTKAKNLPRTSQVNPTQYLEIFKDAKEKGEEVLVLTLSGGLSGTYSSAKMAQEECNYDSITIIDTRHVAMAQRSLIEYAVKLRGEGKSRAEIEKALLDIRDRMCFVVCLDTLTYVKKGGRVPPALAIIGNAIKLKPVVTVDNGKVEPLAKVRGSQAALQVAWNKMEKDGFDDTIIPVCFGHTNAEARGRAFMEESVKKFDIKNYRLHPVGGVIGTHAGPDCVAVSYLKK